MKTFKLNNREAQEIINKGKNYQAQIKQDLFKRKIYDPYPYLTAFSLGYRTYFNLVNKFLTENPQKYFSVKPDEVANFQKLFGDGFKACTEEINENFGSRSLTKDNINLLKAYYLQGGNLVAGFIEQVNGRISKEAEKAN